MNYFITLVVIAAIWWVISVVAEFLSEKLSDGSLTVIRWIVLFPLVYFTWVSAFALFHGYILWMALGFPISLLIGKITAPKGDKVILWIIFSFALAIGILTAIGYVNDGKWIRVAIIVFALGNALVVALVGTFQQTDH